MCVCACVYFVLSSLCSQVKAILLLFYFIFFSLKINKTDNLRGIVIVVELLLKWKDFDCFLNSFAQIHCSITLKSLLPIRTCIKCKLNLHKSCWKQFAVKSIEFELGKHSNLSYSCPPTHRFQFQFSILQSKQNKNNLCTTKSLYIRTQITTTNSNNFSFK